MCVQGERRLETTGHVGKIEHLYPSVQRLEEEPLERPTMQRDDLEADKYVLLMPRSRKQRYVRREARVLTITRSTI
jgi:hypothetical protein